jgi:hypothetical protein
MQLDEETAQCLFEVLPCVPQASISNLNLNISKSISVLPTAERRPAFRCPPTLLLNCIWVHSWEVKGRSLRLSTLLHVVLSLRMSGDIASRRLYVTMMCTGTSVIPYTYSNVIRKITGRHIQIYLIAIPTHCIYNYNGDRSECNRWFCV